MYSSTLSTIFIFLHVLINGTSAIFNASPDVTCGRSLIRRGKIKGGNSALEGEFPWLVSIRFAHGSESVHLCGGALIHSKFVLTAAHCMQNKILRYINIMAGEYDTRGRSSHEQVRGVKQVHLHEEFGKSYINDIAVLELSEPVIWSRYVQPICLPDASVDSGDHALDSQMMTVAGWGYTDENANGGVKATVLQKANVPVVSLSTCQKWFDKSTNKAPGDPQYLLLYKNSHLCAGYEHGKKDSCHGDSGGPLMKIDELGREVVVGVVSSGIGCGRPRMPGIYTRIVSYIPWIRNVLARSGIALRLK